MGCFNFYFIKKILSKLFTKKTLIYIIIFLIILLLRSNVFAVSNDYDIEREIQVEQNQNQMQLAYHCFYPYFGNTPYWEEELKPMIDELSEGRDINIRYLNFSNRQEFHVYLYSYTNATSTTMSSYSGLMDNTSTSILQRTFGPTQYRHYHIIWYKDTNTGSCDLVSNGSSNYTVPYCVVTYKNPTLLEFIKLYKTGSGDYSTLLSLIYSDLSSISTVNEDILLELQDLSTALSQMSSASGNTSTQVSAIANKIEDILDDNQEIISQNETMIEQQQEINENIEQVSQDVQDLTDTITDDTVTSTADDLPSTNVNDPTQTGIDNIFNSIYNAFCVGEAQDIVFPIPFTGKSITLSPYYVRDMLNNNNAGWVYNLIQAFWGYLIGRFIVYDVMKKITKIKSGNIEDLETSNIKGDML